MLGLFRESKDLESAALFPRHSPEIETGHLLIYDALYFRVGSVCLVSSVRQGQLALGWGRGREVGEKATRIQRSKKHTTDVRVTVGEIEYRGLQKASYLI